MKHRITMLLALPLLAVACGCEKFLSVVPDDRTAINTTEKVSELLASAYGGHLFMEFVEPMTDNVDDEGRTERFKQVNDYAYRWEVNDLDDRNDSPIGYWTSCYNAIAVANQALSSIEDLGDGPALRAAKGEALLIRAYYHFMLVNLWAQHFDPATASVDLGIPYVTIPETDPFRTYRRHTVQEVYDFIEADLIAGLERVGKDYVSPKYRFTPEAARAFAIRFYLYKGGDDSWQRVLGYANELLTNPTAQLRDWVGQYATIGGDASALRYASIEEPANILVGAGYSTYGRSVFSYASPPRFAYSVGKYFDITAARNNPFGLSWAHGVSQYGIGDIVTTWKFAEHFVYSNRAAGIGSPYLGWVAFTYDEALLARAEAHAMMGNFDASRADMKLFLSKKLRGFSMDRELTEDLVQSAYPVVGDEIKPHYPLSPQQAVYVKAIATLRRNEFLQEGHRWFDIKRLHLAVRHTIVGEEPITLEQVDLRRALQIPPSAREAGLAANPR